MKNQLLTYLPAVVVTDWTLKTSFLHTYLSWLLLLQQKRKGLAAIALSSVVARMTDSFQVLKVLRCLVRLHSPHVQNQEQEISR